MFKFFYILQSDMQIQGEVLFTLLPFTLCLVSKLQMLYVLTGLTAYLEIISALFKANFIDL